MATTSITLGEPASETSHPNAEDETSVPRSPEAWCSVKWLIDLLEHRPFHAELSHVLQDLVIPLSHYTIPLTTSKLKTKPGALQGVTTQP